MPVCLVHKQLLLLPVLQARLENIRLQNKTQKLEALIKQKVTDSTSMVINLVLRLLKRLERDISKCPETGLGAVSLVPRY